MSVGAAEILSILVIVLIPFVIVLAAIGIIIAIVRSVKKKNAQKEANRLRACLKCGQVINDDSAFCPRCGAKLDNNSNSGSY